MQASLLAVGIIFAYCGLSLAGSVPSKGIIHGTTNSYWGVIVVDKLQALALVDQQDVVLNSHSNGLTLLDAPGYGSDKHPLLFQIGVESSVGVSRVRTKGIAHATIFVPYTQSNEKGGPFTMKLLSFANDSIPIMGPGAIYGGSGMKGGNSISFSETDGTVNFEVKSPAGDVVISGSFNLGAASGSSDELLGKVKSYIVDTPTLIFRRISSYPIFECFEFAFDETATPVTATPVTSCSLTFSDKKLLNGTHNCEWAVRVTGEWDIHEAMPCGGFKRSVNQEVVDKQRPIVRKSLPVEIEKTIRAESAADATVAREVHQGAAVPHDDKPAAAADTQKQKQKQKEEL